MRSLTLLLLLLLLLFSVQRGGATWVTALTDLRRETSPQEATGSGDLGPVEGSGVDVGAPAVAATPGPQRLRRRRSAPDPRCGLRSILLRVRDLGLGYDSDESVLFKYCGGACPRLRSNHDLTLSGLLQSGALPRPPPGQQWHDAPCCRPTHHEDMAFLDNAHRWHKVEKLSAAGCSCVG